MSRPASIIEIVSLPNGEAPEEVRKAWIGCALPCLPSCGHVAVPVQGVLSNVWLMDKVDGFDVPQGIALRVLEHVAPEAARWFEERGFPRKNQNFRFARKHVRVLKELSHDAPGKVTVYDDMETGTHRPVP